MEAPETTVVDERGRFEHLQLWAEELGSPAKAVLASFMGILDNETRIPEKTSVSNASRHRTQFIDIPSTERHSFESLQRYAQDFRQELVKLQPMGSQLRPRKLRRSLMNLLLILNDQYSESYQQAKAGNRDRDIEHTDFLAQVVVQILKDCDDDTKFLCLARDLAGYVSLWPAARSPDWAKSVLEHIFRRLSAALGHDDKDTLIALKFMAENYLLCRLEDGIYSYGVRENTQSWGEMESWCHQQLVQLRKKLGCNHPACLRYAYALARAHLVHGRLDSAEALLREAFDGREAAFGDAHAESLRFIQKLLKTYCEERSGSLKWSEESVAGEAGEEPYDHEWHSLDQDRPRFQVEDASIEMLDILLIDELIELCLDREAYEEAYDLACECRIPHKVTSLASPNDDFAGWSQFELEKGCKIQPRLASLKTPQGAWYWEDSRMYFRSWNQVTLSPAHLKDPFPRLPAKITITKNGLDIKLPPYYSVGGQTDDEIYQHLRSSDLHKLLDAKRRSGDWKILQAFEQQQWSAECRELAEGPANHEFYVFEDALVVSDHMETERTQLGNPLSHIYRFKKLPTPGSVWLVVPQDYLSWNRTFHYNKKAPQLLDPHEPLPDDKPGKYELIQWDLPVLNYKQHFDKTILGKVDELKYGITNAGTTGIDLTVPYLEYAHFQRSTAYRAGLDYRRYLDILMEYSLWNSRSLVDCATEICAGISREKSTSNASTGLWAPRGLSSSSVGIKKGFMNGIPGDSAIIHNGSECSFSLISADWTDWRTFTLHKPAYGNAPSLKLPSGEDITCHGYIFGTWTDGAMLSKQWSGLRLFVVDCQFGEPGSSDAHLFYINSNLLGNGNLHFLSGWEKRFFCAALNFCLFRHAPPDVLAFGSVWKPSRKKKEEPLVENVFWAEMNRREEWDRQYEQRLSSETAKSRNFRPGVEKPLLGRLEQEKGAEEKLRLDWDANHAALGPAQVQ